MRGCSKSSRAVSAFRPTWCPPLTVAGVPVSSSEVRTALQRGDVVAAARFLGRAYWMGGTITSGAGRGRTLGFPTANLAPDRELLIPKGVYGCLAHVDGVAHPAVVNVGVRPTFAETTLAIEAHLLDFTGDLYGTADAAGLRAPPPRGDAIPLGGRAPGPDRPGRRRGPRRGSPVADFTSGGPRGTLPVLSADKTKFFWNPSWGCVSGTRRLEEASRWRLLSTARRA